ncbi:hypothetical protein F5B18DRAFT_635608 [Nemania serpens]|nr:hypothetical protein F5B18DRAFT_635608 [Nemania serpens]
MELVRFDQQASLAMIVFLVFETISTCFGIARAHGSRLDQYSSTVRNFSAETKRKFLSLNSVSPDLIKRRLHALLGRKIPGMGPNRDRHLRVMG